MDSTPMYSNAFALAGRISSFHHTQGDALGYVLVAPSGRALNACAYSLIHLLSSRTRIYIIMYRSLYRQLFLLFGKMYYLCTDMRVSIRIIAILMALWMPFVMNAQETPMVVEQATEEDGRLRIAYR